MGKIVVTEFITLDGVIEDPGGSEGTAMGGWAKEFDQGADGPAFKLAELKAADAQILGRVTYEGFALAWPSMRATTGEFGALMNDMPKFVFSQTLTSATWENTTVLHGDLEAAVAGLRDRFDGNVLVPGSASLVRGLLERDLVDEMNLMVMPVVLGSGQRLFGEGESRRFAVIDSRQAGAVSIMTLRRERHRRRAVDPPG